MSRITLLFTLILLVSRLNAHVSLVYPEGGETFTAGETVNIQWEITVSHNTENWDLYFSEDGGDTWEALKMDISVDSLNYQWLVPDMPTSQAQIRIVMDNDGNDYNDNSENFTIENVTAINENSYEFGLKIFPNPMTESSMITFINTDNEKYVLFLFNSSGQVVRKMDNITTDKVIIKRYDLVNGLYFFQLSSNNEDRGFGKLIIN